MIVYPSVAVITEKTADYGVLREEETPWQTAFRIFIARFIVYICTNAGERLGPIHFLKPSATKHDVAVIVGACLPANTLHIQAVAGAFRHCDCTRCHRPTALIGRSVRFKVQFKRHAHAVCSNSCCAMQNFKLQMHVVS